MTPFRLTAAGLVFLVAGCAGPHRATDSAPQKIEPPARESAPPQPVAVPSEPAPSAPATVVSPSPIVEASPPVEVESPKPQSPAPKPAAKAPAGPAVKKEAAPPPAPKPALDLATLEKRLKDTSAIGVFTKLTLKNQVDDLLGKFRAYYKGEFKTSLAQLRQPYDLLIMKVLSLLQDGDPALARAVADSREAIWGILSDPEKFRNL